MELIGKLKQILPTQSGETSRGQWVRGGFVIETQEQYPKNVAFTMFGEDKVSMITGIPLETQINVHFSPESREYQGRWYTDLRCFRVDTFVQAQPSVAPQQSIKPTEPTPDFASTPQQAGGESMMNTDDDLPF